MINSLCILGGGTSGLVSALMMRQAYPNLKITMIESSQIGIIGVGEGSTEHWKKFMSHVGISLPDLVREAGATFKIGIKFTNWQGDGKHYFHSLSEQYGGTSPDNGLPFTWLQMVAEDWDPLSTVWSLSRESKHTEPLHDILSQYHFDTFKLNDYLHRLCKERNVNIIDREIQSVVLDDQGYVTELVDTTGQIHNYEFYIDSSGFRRVIASKLGAEWVDVTDQLPMNSAIAFPTGYTEDIPSFTEATALSSGWVWRIPTQERYGNGYVFCDNFINETQAYDEVSQYYRNAGIANSIEIGRKVQFGAGYVKEFWIKNCVSIGLSGMFVEPLEASSIGTTIQQCFMLAPNIAFFNRGEDNTAKIYNNHMTHIVKNIIDFIQLHYFTGRTDTDFWRWCSNEIKLTDFNKENLEYFKENFPNVYYFNTPMILFSYNNYAQVMHGLGMFNKEKIAKFFNSHLSQWKSVTDRTIEINEAPVPPDEVFTHRESINRLKERYENVDIKL